MGLASALSTALTGLSASESQIDVVGNNLANSQTVGFKASDTVFATQFLQTFGLGSGPTAGTGGTNPRQTGLGTQVAGITPDFTQGTIEISSSPSDLAIQGDGFFIVEGGSGEQVYTRNGIFKTNAENELVTVTGQRVLGFGIDETFRLQTTELVPISIPLGSAAVAQATENVFLEGTLTPVGNVATTAGVIQSTVLGDGSIPRADASAVTTTVASEPSVAATTTGNVEGGGGTHAEGTTFRYRFTLVSDSGTETAASQQVSVTIPAGNALADNSITLSTLPTGAGYSSVNIYRANATGDFFLLDNAAVGGNYTDDNSVAVSATQLDTAALSGNYSYLVTYYKAGVPESRPSELLGPINVADGRVRLENLPTPPVGVGIPDYDEIRIYRNTNSDSRTFYLVDTVSPGEDYIDSKLDAEISDLNISGNRTLDLDGPKVSSNTLLTNVISRDELTFENMFSEGVMEFRPTKGGRSLAPKTFQITATTTVQDYLEFMEDALGIRNAIDDPQNPIPGSLNSIVGESGVLSAGAVVQDGRIRIVSNNGVDSAVGIGLSGIQVTDALGNTDNVNLGFGSIQQAVGQSVVSDFVAYDSLGIALNVRITAVLESRSGTETVYRWMADSPDNDPVSGYKTGVGTGLISFDGEGNLISVTNSTVSIDRRNIPSSSPLEFNLDFSQVSGLAASSSTLSASRQDGSAPGKLSSFLVGEDGVVRGVFTNGVTRDLGQIRIATFANPAGLQQLGQNLYARGVNSGLPVEGNPGGEGLGTIVSGAVELSNTDIGRNLIDLVLATTQYRGNTRVINTAQELLDELLNLRR